MNSYLKMGRWLLLALALLGLGSAPATAGGLDAATDKLLRLLEKHADGAGKRVLVSATDFYDADTRISLPLAVTAREHVAARLKAAGYELLEPSVELNDAWMVQCRWKRTGERLSLGFIVTPWHNGKRGTMRVTSASLPLSEVQPELLEADLASYARTVIHRLALNERMDRPRKVYVRPVQVGEAVGGNEANGYFTRWVSEAVAESNLLIPVATKQELAQLDPGTIRTRGIRPKPKPGLSLTGNLVAAQGELSTAVNSDGQLVTIHADLMNDDGAQVSTAAVEFPASALPKELAAKLKEPASGLTAGAAVSKNGMQLELSTSRGEGESEYRAGEKIQFVLRVNRPAHVYLFDFDAGGNAVLLYPAEGVASKPLPAGQPLVLPDDGMPYELEVTPPFGTDLVWAVASAEPLHLPATMTGEWASADGLRKQVRRLLSGSSGHAEAEVLVKTGK